MKDIIISIIAFFQRDVETEKSKKNTRRTIKMAAVAMTAICFMMTSINFINDRVFMGYTTLFLMLIFGGCTIASFFFYNEKAIKLITVVTVGVLFSYYVLNGGNNGFAILWTILVPFAYIAIVDLGYGIILGIYFWVFILVMFWTPLREYLLYQYSQDMLQRFPVYYLGTSALAIIIG